ncbi:MAG: YebC/PmpR family DNA-binding transcriptional regulator [bacterium]|nr:YebC/PmpR family DNA-binding transcriptional regulator [bacterium]
MSGHSKWETIKRQKGANDAKRGAVFTKLGNAIAVAARSGADPEMNFSLKLAIDRAKAANMPNNNIDRAIERASGKGADELQEVVYEGYGSGGVAVIIECATDNIKRTYPFVKNAFVKNGGNIAEKGSVLFQFDQKGVIRVKGSGEELLLQVLDAGAEDAEEDGDSMVVYTNHSDFAKVRDALKEQGLEISEADLQYIPNAAVSVDDNTSAKVLKLMDALDDLDDVVNTYTNLE